MKKAIVISNYPPRGSTHGSKFGGVASYTKNTLDSIEAWAREDNLEQIHFYIMADKHKGYRNYSEANKTVRRVWRRNDLLVFLKLFLRILKKPDYKDIIIAFEFSLFGLSKLIVGMIPAFIFLLRLIGKRVYFISHHVVLSTEEVSGQLGLKRHSLINKIYDALLKLIYYFIVQFSNQTIVFEEYLRQRLLKVAPFKNRIITISHGVEIKELEITKEEAKSKLGYKTGDFILMSFGFLAWYKGSDWLVKTFAGLVEKNLIPKNVKLVMAGGKSRNHNGNPIYESMLNNMHLYAEKYPDRIKITGFLEEHEIQDYFAAADLITLPYRVLLSASGPFSFILTYSKPFIASTKLKGYMKNSDFKYALGKSHLHMHDIFFKLNEASLKNKINMYSSDGKYIENSKAFSKLLVEQRSWEIIGKRYGKILYKNSEKTNIMYILERLKGILDYDIFAVHDAK